ncbi:MAG: hypothetical protein HUU35_11710, partial [Armatimonadetes bacterium]|nr:hypothetical protein [Armatimonadota bacterium]
ALPGLAPQMFGGRGTTASPSAPSHKLLADQVAEDQAIATDDPWQVAWHSDRLAIWLPQSADDLEAMQKLGEVKAIYFSQRVAPAAGQFTARERGDWWSWAQAMPQGFLDYRPLESRVPGERILIRSTAR